MYYEIHVAKANEDLGRFVFGTDVRSEVIPAFRKVLDNAKLHGKPLVATVMCKGRFFARHKFDAHPGDVAYLADKLDRLIIPSPYGRPAKLKGGKNVTVCLPEELIEFARKFGSGNFSAGVRAALTDALKRHT